MQHQFTILAGVMACASSAMFDACAQAYPTKPVRMLVGFPVGVSSDTGARLISQKLSDYSGQSVIVENRPGAAGQLATERLLQTPPDGYTLMMLTAAETIRPAMRAKLPYDAKRDLAPISLVALSSYVLLAHPSVPARNIKEVIALATAAPGKMSYGSTGVGSTSHLAGELFNHMARVKLLMVSYKGSTESAVATASGQVDMSFSTITAVLPLLDSGRLKPIALTALKRSPLLPNLPTIDESGVKGYECVAWFGVVAPAGTPKEVIDRVNTLIVKAGPELAPQMNKQGLDVKTNTPEQFGAMIRNEIDQNIKIIRAAGIKPE